MSKYVPPGRRRQSELSSKADVPTRIEDSAVSLEEIKNHFWPISDESLQRTTSHGREGKTLHDSADRPGQLSWLVLFDGAHPRWQTDKIIFTKSSLELLPASVADSPAAAPPTESLRKADGAETAKDGGYHPIAVFMQLPRRGQTGRSYRFEGWYQIERLTFLEPKTPELVRMLEQKWTRVDSRGNVRQERRDQGRWEESMSHRWAVVKLEKDAAADKVKGVPKIERLPDLLSQSPEAPKKSVNEMLAELRMGQGKPEGSEGNSD